MVSIHWMVNLDMVSRKTTFAVVSASITSICVLLGTTSPATAQTSIAIKIDGRLVRFPSPPVQSGGRVLVPMRGVFEALGAMVDYDAATSTVFASKRSTQVKLKIGTTSAIVNDFPVRLDAPAQSRLGTTFVPLRFVSETLGAVVRWDPASATVFITTGSLPALPAPESYTPVPNSEPSPPPSPPVPTQASGIVDRITPDAIILTNRNAYNPSEEVLVSMPGSRRASWLDLRAGDNVNLTLDADGRVAEVKVAGKLIEDRIVQSLIDLKPIQGLWDTAKDISINGNIFDTAGLGSPDERRESKTLFDNRLDYDIFECSIGYRTKHSRHRGTLQFIVLGDGKTLYQSPWLSPTDDALKVSVAIKGYRGITLESRAKPERGTGFSEEIAAWTDPVFVKLPESRGLPVDQPFYTEPSAQPKPSVGAANVSFPATVLSVDPDTQTLRVRGDNKQVYIVSFDEVERFNADDRVRVTGTATARTVTATAVTPIR
jgi:hypothetical protein